MLEYFDSDIKIVQQLQWVEYPFSNSSLTSIDDSMYKAKEELILLHCETRMKVEFEEKSIAEFWVSRQTRFPTLAGKALAFLTAFPTTWLCESAFSKIQFMKNKSRNQLDIHPDARTALSNTAPEFQILVKQMQHHPSH